MRRALWVCAWGLACEEKNWAVLVDREVPRVHVLVKSEEDTVLVDDSPI